MKRKLFFAFLLSGILGLAQSSCNYGIVSDQTGTGENITAGGSFQYTVASDFDVSKGKVVTVNQLAFNVIKSQAEVTSVNVSILKEFQGMPGEELYSFNNLVPVSQILDYETQSAGDDSYKITVNFPQSFDLQKGKYFVKLTAKTVDATSVFWEFTKETTRKVGRFDFTKFDSDPWFGGFSYYDHVFSLIGNCNDTGEPVPDYGTEYTQGNAANDHEAGVNLVGRRLADDFIVPENSKFTFTKFKMSTLQLGNIKNATINVRASQDDMPGEILYSFENVGPRTENFYGYFPVPGFPLDVVAVDLEFEWNEPVELLPGKYFIEVMAIPQPFTDYQRWEATSQPGIGGYSYTSYDDGETWETNGEYNFVFDIYGYTNPNLEINDQTKNTISVYPNPVSDIVTIDSSINTKKVSVYNAAGQIVKTLDKIQNAKINLTDLSRGIYFISAQLENGETKTFRIIKK